MGGTLGGAAGGAGLYRARLRWATGCAGIAGRGTSTLGACGLSMLVGFYTLGNGGCNLGGKSSSHLSFSLGWWAVRYLGLVSIAQLLSVYCRY